MSIFLKIYAVLWFRVFVINCILLRCLRKGLWWWRWSFLGDLLDSLMLLRLLIEGDDSWLWWYFGRLSCCFHVILRENWALDVISRAINGIVIIVVLSRSANGWKRASICTLILEILRAIRPTAAVLLCRSIIALSTSCRGWSWISIVIFTRLLLWYFRLMISIQRHTAWISCCR